MIENIPRPESVVLTREQYEQFIKNHTPVDVAALRKTIVEEVAAVCREYREEIRLSVAHLLVSTDGPRIREAQLQFDTVYTVSERIRRKLTG